MVGQGECSNVFLGLPRGMVFSFISKPEGTDWIGAGALLTMEADLPNGPNRFCACLLFGIVQRAYYVLMLSHQLVLCASLGYGLRHLIRASRTNTPRILNPDAAEPYKNNRLFSFYA